MATHKSCPRCKTPLTIPQPVPEQIRCDKCGAVVKNRSANVEKPVAPVPGAAASPQPQTPKPPAAKASRPNLLVVAGLLCGVLLLCIVPIAVIGLGWVYSGKEKQDQPLPLDITKEGTKKSKDPPPPDPRIKIVQPAVDKGIAYLQAKVPALAGQRAGVAGLNGLTLLECGVPPDDPAILQIGEIILGAAPEMNRLYDIAPCLFFLNRLDESRPLNEKDRNLARSLALRIIAGQRDTGMWSYTGGMMIPELEAKLLDSLKNGTYKPKGPVVGNDHPSMSNTQFAMLAVWGSRKHGIPVRDPLLALAAYLHANQHPDGNWDYAGLGGPNPVGVLGGEFKATSTCAALISMAIESALLEDKEFASIPRQPGNATKKADVDKAFAFVARTIGRKKGDPGGGSETFGGKLLNADAYGDLYFLWTLERVGMIYSKDLIGGKDWYDWGYPFVLKAQQPTGEWNDRFGPQVDTCFALLFLKRANIAKDLTEMIRTRDGRELAP